MTMVFKQLEGDIITLRQKGVFKQTDLYARGKELFARHGSGFVRIYENGSTSVAGLLWDGLQTERFTTADKFGRLEVEH